MSVQWADSFSRYGVGAGSTGEMLDGLPYSNIGTGGSAGRVVVSPDPNDINERAFHIGANGNNWPRDFRISLPNVVSGKVGVCFRAWLNSLATSEGDRPALVGVQRANGDYMAYVRIEQNGAIAIVGRVSNALVELENTVNPAVSPSSFNHYEFIHDGTTGEGQLYLNGVLRVSYSGVDAGENLVFVNFSFRTSSGIGESVFIKDLVIWDSNGTQNNSVMGTVIVRGLKPNADVTLGGWVPSTGTTGFNLLNKTTPNDATYLSADDAPPALMSFDLENLPPDITSVRGLVPVVRMRKVDGGDANVQSGLSPNGTDWDDGADRPITSSFTYYFDISELDPATGTPWSPPAVDNVKIRIDRTI